MKLTDGFSYRVVNLMTANSFGTSLHKTRALFRFSLIVTMVRGFTQHNRFNLSSLIALRINSNYLA